MVEEANDPTRGPPNVQWTPDTLVDVIDVPRSMTISQVVQIESSEKLEK